MNKTDLIEAIAKDAKLTKKDAEAALSATMKAIETALVKEEKVVLVGFGTFETKKRAARKGRNPSTKEVINIPASKVPSFKAGKDLKTKVNAGKKKK
ncbi:MAG: HU family DNA-binding protein [Clostridiales bacterium]|nr:HU family DNA-binding protein [Clostridiales bacterium]MCR5617697.1 HU family DNA-binding protein [Clostridiales bacterium]MCR5804747.1 HU family DNA-binding protein [Clostridia bacterium]